MRGRTLAVHIIGMTAWGWIAAAYGVLLAFASVAISDRPRRLLATATSTAYAAIALMAARSDAFWIRFAVPGALLYGGYRLSGFLVRAPDAWLERLLQSSDRRLFEKLAIDRALAASPRWVLEILEGSYAADYLVVASGAVLSAAAGEPALAHYWTLVLGAELPCYATLAWLQSRPPRSLEPAGIVERRAPSLRRLNTALLDRASVQLNTIPSGHVAGAVAIALAILPANAIAGWMFVVAAAMIAVAAVVCRYHYAADCLLGAVVGYAAWLML